MLNHDLGAHTNRDGGYQLEAGCKVTRWKGYSSVRPRLFAPIWAPHGSIGGTCGRPRPQIIKQMGQCIGYGGLRLLLLPLFAYGPAGTRPPPFEMDERSRAKYLRLQPASKFWQPRLGCLSEAI